MMSSLIASIILCCISGAYAVLLKRKLHETVFLSVATVITVLYCFGLANIDGSLLFGIYFIVALSVLSLAFLIYTLFSNTNGLMDAGIFKGLLIYGVFYLLALYLGFDRGASMWDELAHWALHVKYSYLTDSLIATANLYETSALYPPGVTLFRYFIARFSSQFAAHNMYIASDILYFSMIMPFADRIFKRGTILKGMLLLAVFLVLPVSANNYVTVYLTLYLDTIMGIIFGMSGVYYFYYKYEESLYGLLMVLASVFLLTQVKTTGLVFSLIIIGIIFMDIVICRRDDLKKYIGKNDSTIKKAMSFTLLISPLLVFVFSWFSWSNLLVRANHNTSDLNVVSHVVALFTEQHADYQYKIIDIFLNRVLWEPNSFLKISIFTACVIFAFLCCFLSYYKKRYSVRRMLLFALTVAAGLAAYQFSLMLVYMFVASPGDGAALADHSRYTLSYFYGMMYFVLLFFLPDPLTLPDTRVHPLFVKVRAWYQGSSAALMFAKVRAWYRGSNAVHQSTAKKSLKRSKRGKPNDISRDNSELHPSVRERFEMVKTAYRNDKKGIAFSLVRQGMYLLICVVLLIKVYDFTNENLFANTFRSKWHWFQFESKQATHLNESQRQYLRDKEVYLVAQGTAGFGFFGFRYEVFPYIKIVNGNLNSDIQPSQDSATYWSAVFSADEWEAYLLSNGIEFVYVMTSSEIFDETYGRFFINGEVLTATLYQVKNNDGNMLLIPFGEDET